MAVSSLRLNINSAGAQLVWMRCYSICQKKSLHLMLSFHSSFYSLHFWKFEVPFQLNRLIQEGMFMFVFVIFHSAEEIPQIQNWQTNCCCPSRFILAVQNLQTWYIPSQMLPLRLHWLWFNDNPCRERIYNN